MEENRENDYYIDKDDIVDETDMIEESDDSDLKKKKNKKKKDDIKLTQKEVIGVIVYLVISAIAVFLINTFCLSKTKESELVLNDEYSLVYPAKQEKTVQVFCLPMNDTYGIKVFMTPDPNRNSHIVIDMLTSFGLPINQWEINSDDLAEGYYYLSFDGLGLEEGENYYLDAWSDEDSDIAILTGQSNSYGYGSVALDDINWVYSIIYNPFTSYVYSIELALILFGLIAFLFYKRGVKESNVLSMIFAVAAVIFFFVTAYNTVFDEEGHFLRSYEISEGRFLTANTEVSGELFNGAKNVTKSLTSEYGGHFFYVRQENLMEHNIDNDNVGVEKPVESLYSPTAYIPQALGLFVAHLATKNVFLFYGFGRLFTLIINVILVIGAIKLIPEKKILILAIAMNPVALAEMVSYSALGNILALSLFFMAYVLRCRNKEKINIFDKLMIFILGVIIGLSKIGFIPVVLMVFLLRDESFSSKVGAKVYKCVSLLVSAAAGIAWIMNASADNGIFSGTAAETTGALEWIRQLFGGVFGKGMLTYNDAVWIVICAVILIEFFINRKEDVRFDISVKGRLLIGIVIAAFVGISVVSYFVHPTAGISNVISGIQGRYFIPMLLPLGLLIKGKEVEGKTVKLTYIEITCLLLVVMLAAVSTMQAYI